MDASHVARRRQSRRGLRRRAALRARQQQAADAGEPLSAELAGDINRFSVSTVCDQRELFWSRHLVNFRLAALARLGWGLLGAALQTNRSGLQLRR